MTTPRIIPYILSIMLSVCLMTLNSSAQEKSRVESFSYGGYGDNMYASLQGNIFYSEKKGNQLDKLLPLKGTQIISFDSTGKIFKMVTADKDGAFLIEFPLGTYKLTFIKKDYQTIIATNYLSVGDQVSSIKIILEKGTSIQYFKIPDWTKE